MDWRMQIAMTEEWLDRVVLLLLSLAEIATRAASAPDAQRRLTLAILRHGEAAARDAFGVIPAAANGTDPEDALALALSLRALAYVVRIIAARMRHGGSEPWPADWAVHRYVAVVSAAAETMFTKRAYLDSS